MPEHDRRRRVDRLVPSARRHAQGAGGVEVDFEIVEALEREEPQSSTRIHAG